MEKRDLFRLIKNTLYKAIANNVLLTPYNYYRLFFEEAFENGFKKGDIIEIMKNENILDEHKEAIIKVIHDIENVYFNEKQMSNEQSIISIIEEFKKTDLIMQAALKNFMKLLGNHKNTLDLIQSVAYKDSLTNLYTRDYLYSRLNEMLYMYKRYKRNFGIIMFDIDNFKDINDKYGHIAGDDTLKNVGKIILSNIRLSDTAIRYGGDEFIILLPETNINDAYKVAKKLKYKFLQNNFTFKNHTFNLTLSIGVTSANETDNVESILEKVDSALFSSKKIGKNSITIF